MNKLIFKSICTFKNYNITTECHVRFYEKMSEYGANHIILH